jgi:NDP-sugar pyrophosphorylase family protein
MKAMIFAAGKGTRLKPLTDNTPKALVKVNGTPMLQIIINKLIKTGVTEIIINVHYLADQIIEFLKLKNNFGIRIEISHEKEELLDTGGGLKKAAWFFDDNKPFILHNVDVISNINLIEMMNFHKNSNSLVTLAVRRRDTSRYFLFNNSNILCGWENTKTKERIISNPNKNLNQFAFSGIHIIDPNIFNFLQNNGSFSIVPFYIKFSKSYKIMAFQHDKDFWLDVGTSAKLSVAEKNFNSI